MIRIEKPNTAKKVAIAETAKVRLRKRSRGIIGSAALASATMKATRKTTPTPNQPRTDGSSQLVVSARVSAIKTGTTAQTKVITPTRSSVKRAPLGWTIGSNRPIRYSEMSPTGTLTKKIQCQERLSVRKPPRNGPIRKATPKTPPKSPWYLPRSAGVNRSPMTASEIGKSAPAPMPWRPRNAISSHMVWLKPESTDPIRNRTMPISSMGFRPK